MLGFGSMLLLQVRASIASKNLCLKNNPGPPLGNLDIPRVNMLIKYMTTGPILLLIRRSFNTICQKIFINKLIMWINGKSEKELKRRLWLILCTTVIVGTIVTLTAN